MKEIKLKDNKVALVDNDDYELVSQYKWSLSNPNRGRLFYAVTRINGKYAAMHNLIMNGLWIDHKDGNGLNNSRENLRFCNNRQNQGNSNSHSNSTSRYKGIYWYERYQKWVAMIRIGNKRKYLGSFILEVDAAKAYDEAALEYFGEFARLNVGASIGEGVK